ncbi:hypothetical protein SSOG_06204 [Streptomyces himastatinicus ATCC 53653]|uniref:Uncharacterized protein n=1 Tax=Streptomyces himastatinicus ATCC 53653 TaxID=457427 RepID=D9WUV8_9ACTN|nr:hypothetical protein [Streptomyces himastatinicus]EFL26490.1 hypothetical protein SSOG_06204 [Streptomyces himastatinicus ATCC 53653]
MTAAADLDPVTLSREQLQGWACVLCGAPLTVDRPLDTVTIDHGTTWTTYVVWACAPACGVRPAAPESTPWGRFLDHAVGCLDCRAGQRCPVGNGLHHAVREALTATAP